MLSLAEEEQGYQSEFRETKVTGSIALPTARERLAGVGPRVQQLGLPRDDVLLRWDQFSRSMPDQLAFHDHNIGKGTDQTYLAQLHPHRSDAALNRSISK